MEVDHKRNTDWSQLQSRLQSWKQDRVLAIEGAVDSIEGAVDSLRGILRPDVGLYRTTTFDPSIDPSKLRLRCDPEWLRAARGCRDKASFVSVKWCDTNYEKLKTSYDKCCSDDWKSLVQTCQQPQTTNDECQEYQDGSFYWFKTFGWDPDMCP
ncbi:unnamed protein product [Amoebophrya sp. A120]|nr:unnamed protein product [Amoebophrya sp. A120]|eukprot:GSA120T00014930001.1